LSNLDASLHIQQKFTQVYKFFKFFQKNTLKMHTEGIEPPSRRPGGIMKLTQNLSLYWRLILKLIVTIFIRR